MHFWILGGIRGWPWSDWPLSRLAQSRSTGAARLPDWTSPGLKITLGRSSTPKCPKARAICSTRGLASWGSPPPPSDCSGVENACLLLPGSGSGSLTHRWCIPLHPCAALCCPLSPRCNVSLEINCHHHQPTPHHTLAPCNQTNPNPRRLGHGAPLDRSQGQQGARSSATTRQDTAAGGPANYLRRCGFCRVADGRDAPTETDATQRCSRAAKPTDRLTPAEAVSTRAHARSHAAAIWASTAATRLPGQVRSASLPCYTMEDQAFPATGPCRLFAATFICRRAGYGVGPGVVDRRRGTRILRRESR